MFFSSKNFKYKFKLDSPNFYVDDNTRKLSIHWKKNFSHYFYGPPDGSQRAICFCLVRPSVRLSVRPSVRPTVCRHYSKTVRRSILIFIYVVPNILKWCTFVSVCPSVRLLGQNSRLNLGNFSLIFIVNTKSFRHYSSETVSRSILIVIHVVSNILKLCTLVSVCPSVCLLGQKSRLNLGNFSLTFIAICLPLQETYIGLGSVYVRPSVRP